MTQRMHAAIETRVLEARLLRLTLMRHKAQTVADESDRLSSEAQIDLGMLRRMLREDAEAITAELDLRKRMIRPVQIPVEADPDGGRVFGRGAV